jgi:TonB family protein
MSAQPASGGAFPTSSSATDPHASPSSVQASTPIVFLADSEDLSRAGLALALRERGAAVVEFANGSTLFDQATTQAHDLIVMDTELAEVDGFQTFARLQHVPGKSFRIVFLTRFEHPGVAEICKQRGAVDYLGKSQPFHEIVEAIQKSLEAGPQSQRRRAGERLFLHRMSRELVAACAAVAMIGALWFLSQGRGVLGTGGEGVGGSRGSGSTLATRRSPIDPAAITKGAEKPAQPRSAARVAGAETAYSPTLQGAEEVVSSNQAADVTSSSQAVDVTSSNRAADDFSSNRTADVAAEAQRTPSRGGPGPRGPSNHEAGVGVMAQKEVTKEPDRAASSDVRRIALEQAVPAQTAHGNSANDRDPETARVAQSSSGRDDSVEAEGQPLVDELKPDARPSPPAGEEGVGGEQANAPALAASEATVGDYTLNAIRWQPQFVPVDSRPARVSRLQLHYPRGLAERRIEGDVMLWVLLNESGTVEDVRPLRSSGQPELDRSAAEALRRVTFRPAVRDGKAVPTWTQQKVVFKLGGNPVEVRARPPSKKGARFTRGGMEAKTVEAEERLLEEERARGEQANTSILAGAASRTADYSLSAIRRWPRFVPVDARPFRKSKLRPQYPRALADRKIGGAVTLWVLVNQAGGVEDVRVLRSSGQPDLDRSAMEALSRAAYKPALREGQPVPTWTQQQIVFKLD